MRSIMFIDMHKNYTYVSTYKHIVSQECLAAGKFGEFGESSVIRQALTSQILAYKCVVSLMTKIYLFVKLHFAKYF